MASNIGSDVNRFKDIVRGKIKSNLGKYVSSEKLLGQQGSKTVKIPIHSIDLPHFTYGGKGGGTGQGDGEPGDPMGGKEGQGAGKAGDQHQEPLFEEEFSTDELAQMLGEYLELPDIEDKGKGKISSSSDKYRTIRRVGPEGLKSFKRTYKEALKRSISSGTYDPSNPVVIPIKDDKRYRASDTVELPETNTVIIYLMDCSGSMTNEARHTAKSLVFWTDLWLQKQYGSIETRFIIHDTEASEVDREQFFSVQESGGTIISSAYKYADHLIETEYPFSEWNTYICHASDGDNWSDTDNADAVDLLKKKILPNCNGFFYANIDTPHGSGEFLRYLVNNFTTSDNIRLAAIPNRDGILPAIKAFFSKGQS